MTKICFLALVSLLVQGGGGSASIAAEIGQGLNPPEACADRFAEVEDAILVQETISNVRGKRYGEVVGAKLSGSNIRADVYSTFGINDCPEAQWSKLDTSKVAKQLGVVKAVANGPFYYMMDTLTWEPDPKQVTLGELSMRKVGTFDLPFSEVSKLESPYYPHKVKLNTSFIFASGKPVFELVDGEGKIYILKAYSTQKVQQTQNDLPNLGSVLKLPTGWSFRTRVLTSDLKVAPPDGVGTFLQDDNANAYQLIP